MSEYQACSANARAKQAMPTVDCLNSVSPCGPEQYDMRALYELCSAGDSVDTCIEAIDHMASGTRLVGELRHCNFVVPSQYVGLLSANYRRYGWAAEPMANHAHSNSTDTVMQLRWNENAPLIGRKPAEFRGRWQQQ